MNYLAFMAGLIGSTHCLFMCGPIASTLIVPTNNLSKKLIWILSYNIGRTTTYILLGCIISVFSQTLQWLDWLNIASIVLGCFFIFKGLKIDRHLFKRDLYFRGFHQLQFFRNSFKNLLSKKKSLSRSFIVGIFNGFLPCGLVYTLIGFCIVQTTFFDRILVMGTFGLGTMPLFIILSIIPMQFASKNQMIYERIQNVFLIFLGILFIYRGITTEVPLLDELLTNTSLQRIPMCD